jgi:hypothetical protein
LNIFVINVIIVSEVKNVNLLFIKLKKRKKIIIFIIINGVINMSTSTSSSSSSSSFYSTPAVSVASGISSKDGQLKSGKKTFSIWDYIPAASQSSSSGRSQMADCCASSPSQQAKTAAKANKCAMCEKEAHGKGQVRVGNTIFFFCDEQHKKEFIAEYNKKHQAMQKPAAPAEAKKGKPLGVIERVVQFVATCVSSVAALAKGHESMIF